MTKTLNKKPNRFINGLLVFLFSPLFKYYFRFRFDRSNIVDLKGPAIFISNHASALDVFLMGISAYPITINYVAGYEWFHNPILNFILKRLKAIPKFQYQLDIESLKEMFRVIEDKKVLGLFPSGRLSSDGKGFKVETNVAKLLKKLNVPVYFFRIDGSYMSFPKWARCPRRGRIEGSYKLIFDQSSLETSSIDEITNTLNQFLSYDEYTWSTKNSVEFSGKYLAENLENIIYLCPACNEEYKIKTKNDLISCECGLNTKINKLGQLDHGFKFKYISDWNEYQKNIIKKDIIDGKIQMIDNCIVKESSTTKKSKTILGNGIVTLIDNNLICKLNDGKTELKFNLIGLKSLPFKAGKNFELASGDRIYTFELVNGKAASKWSLAVEAINEVNSHG